MVTRQPSRIYPSSGDPLHEHLGRHLPFHRDFLPDAHDPGTGNLDIPFHPSIIAAFSCVNDRSSDLFLVHDCSASFITRRVPGMGSVDQVRPPTVRGSRGQFKWTEQGTKSQRSTVGMCPSG